MPVGEGFSSDPFSIRYEANSDPNLMATVVTRSGRKVLIVTAPASSIDGGTGPVVIASDFMDNVIVVYSEEYIDEMAPNSDDEVVASIAAVTTVIKVGAALGLDYIEGGK